MRSRNRERTRKNIKRRNTERRRTQGTSSVARAQCERFAGRGSTGRNVISVARRRAVRPSPPPRTYFRPLYTQRTYTTRPRAHRRTHTHRRATTRTHNLADVRRATRPWPSVGVGGKSVYICTYAHAHNTHTHTRARAMRRQQSAGVLAAARQSSTDVISRMDDDGKTGDVDIVVDRTRAFFPVAGGPRISTNNFSSNDDNRNAPPRKPR